MILSLRAFIQKERSVLEELEVMLKRLEDDPGLSLSVTEVERLDYLYHRAASALSKLQSLPATEQMQKQLATLVARAHTELHDPRERPLVFRPWLWFWVVIPTTLRRHANALGLALIVTLLGAVFGAVALASNQPDVKAIVMPFAHLQGTPTERVMSEQAGGSQSLSGHYSQFAAQLMVNNIRVSIMAMAFGVFFGFGTLVLLFYNGVILGAVIFDYLQAGQGLFLAGWLLPHGCIEIPAILIAGQAGFVLGSAMLGWGGRTRMADRLRQVGRDLMTLMGAVALLLVWAGIVESFLSQHHEPIIPYAAKITFGILEFSAFTVWLALGGRSHAEQANPKVVHSSPWSGRLRLGKRRSA